MSWPTAQDYNEAIQSPAICFGDAELKRASVEINALGLPKCVSGAFASVYRLRSDQGDWAVRCFLSDISQVEQRYQKLSSFILSDRIEETLPFEFISKGIRIGSRWHPIVRMPWLDALTLDEYVRRIIGESQRIEELAEKFLRMYFTLKENGIAHGDLQHGNILVLPDGELRLVDYDGMFVPGLEGSHSPELGHPSYQHPRRDASHFNAQIDDFSAALIYGSLRALAADPTLLHNLQACEDKLLFNRGDLENPIFSKTFRVLEHHQHDEIKTFARHMRKLIASDLSDVPAFGGTFIDDPSLPPLQDPALIYLPLVTSDSSSYLPSRHGSTSERDIIYAQTLAKYVITPRLQVLALQAGKYRHTRFHNPQLEDEYLRRTKLAGWRRLLLFVLALVSLMVLFSNPSLIWFTAAAALLLVYVRPGEEKLRRQFQVLSRFAEDNEPQTKALTLRARSWFNEFTETTERQYSIMLADDTVGAETIVDEGNWFATKVRRGDETTIIAPVWMHPDTGRPLGVFYDDKVYWFVDRRHPIDLQPKR